MNMSTWKIWVTSIVMIILIAIVALFSAIWNNISTEWKWESVSAQYALNHSPLEELTRHSVFTASGDEEVFYGYDVFHRPWYVFVRSNPLHVQSVPAEQLLNKKQILKEFTYHYKMTVMNLSIGDLSSQTASLMNTKAKFVWEAYGKINGRFTYLYLNAQTGNLVANMYFKHHDAQSVILGA